MPKSTQSFYFRNLEISTILISIAMLMLQIGQTITISLQALEKNAFLVVSLCLLGLGSGGSIGTFFGCRKKIPILRSLHWNAMAFAVSIVISTIASSRTNNLSSLIGFGVVPYIFVGLYLSFLFRAWPERANRFYFCNLIGSGFGCVALLGIITITNDITLSMLFIAILSLIATAFIGATISLRFSIVSLFFILIVLSLIPFRSTLYRYHPEATKGMALIMNNPKIESQVVWSRWGYLGRLDILKPGVGIEHFRLGGSLIKNLIEKGCDVRYLFASGGNWTKAINFHNNSNARAHFIRNSRHSVAYLFAKEAEVLNIGFGGGVDIFLALMHGAKSVMGIEINPLMIAAGKDYLSGYFENFYNDPRVTIRNMDGRTYIKNTDKRFDIISLTAVDTGELLHSNAHVLLENYLYTQEAFDDYLRVLKHDGILYVSRPYIQTMRTLATSVSALQKTGIQDPRDHFAILGKGEIGRNLWRSVLVSKEPLTKTQVDLIQERYPDQIGYLPDYEENEDNYTSLFFAAAQGRATQYIDSWSLDFSPVTDDRPFFYEYHRTLHESVAGQLLLNILKWVMMIALGMIVLPLTFLRLPGKSVGLRLFGAIGYFSAIGAGFMFIEIGLIQKLVLFLGDPSYSVTVTLFSILVFSGLGSMFAQRFDATKIKTALKIFVPIVLSAFFYALWIGPTLKTISSDSIILRIIITVILLAPGSFFMGMPFPTMIRLLQGDDKALIPWAWAVNAFASVAASVMTVLIAMQMGFSSVMYIGVVFYIVAFLFYLLRKDQVRI